MYESNLSNWITIYAVELMRAADRMNLIELEKVCLFHVSLMINRDNVCKIYKEVHEREPIVESLVRQYNF